jgi:nitrogen fixation/metabolism regulation signal transduction histidine kinase
MIKYFKTLELEWKILLLSALLFAGLFWPVQHLYITRMSTVLHQSTDARLEAILRQSLDPARKPSDTTVMQSIMRARQWQAMLPVILDEQRQAVRWFSIVLFVLLFVIAFYVLTRLTRPIKKLSQAAVLIGKNQKVSIPSTSGGALGKLEQAMDTMQKELVSFREHAQAEGMEIAWRDIARVMAHEIKNPLTPIRLTLDKIGERIERGEAVSSEDLAKYSGRIGLQIEHLEALVNEFRSFAREPEVRLQRVRLAPLVQDISQDMSKALTTAITGDAAIDADPRLVTQVLINLWKNSAEAGAKHISVTIEETGGTICMAIADDGPGIPADRIERVWVPYVTYKKGGTGLGLPVVKRLVESMRGTIELRSSTAPEDHGVTVRFMFATKTTAEPGEKTP